MNASEKAALFQTTFTTKLMLSPIIENEYTPSVVAQLIVDNVLQKLRVYSGTGSDQISTKVLRNYAVPIAEPISLICNMILDHNRLLTTRRYYWICVIHKPKFKTDPVNYRNVHVTLQLSQLCERIFIMASKYLSKQQKTTVHEHEKPGYRDALVARFRQKLWWLENENNRELYCNDVS